MQYTGQSMYDIRVDMHNVGLHAVSGEILLLPLANVVLDPGRFKEFKPSIYIDYPLCGSENTNINVFTRHKYGY